MQMLNFEVKEFAKFLVGLKLAGKESRMRTRFVKLLADRLKQIEDEREELINQFAEKDHEDKPLIVIDNDGREIYHMTDIATYNREYTVLMREEFILPETEDRKEMFNTLREIVLNVDLVFDGDEAFVYDRWCEIVEE